MHFGPSSLLVSKAAIDQGPVVQRPISTNPGLNFNPGFFFFCFKAFSRIIFPFFLEQPITELQTRSIKLNLLFKLLYLNSNFALTLGYFNPALNNSAGVFLWRSEHSRSEQLPNLKANVQFNTRFHTNSGKSGQLLLRKILPIVLSNPSSPNIHVEILQTDLHTFP